MSPAWATCESSTAGGVTACAVGAVYSGSVARNVAARMAARDPRCHVRLEPRTSPYRPTTQHARGITAARARYSEMSIARRRTGLNGRPNDQPKEPAPAAAASTAIQCACAGAETTVTANPAVTLTRPPEASAIRRTRPECVRARRSSARPTTAVNTAALSREPPSSSRPQATSTVPRAVAPDDPMTRPVRVRWARAACASIDCHRMTARQS